MNDDSGLLGWILTGVAAIISALSGAVTWFYRTQIADYQSNEVKLESSIAELRRKVDECETDRSDIRVELAKCQERISALEAFSCNRIGCDDRTRIGKVKPC